MQQTAAAPPDKAAEQFIYSFYGQGEPVHSDKKLWKPAVQESPSMEQLKM